jgi:chromosome segregation ATPase
MSMLMPRGHEPPPEAARLRQRVESLHRLLNSSEGAKRRLEHERDLARWQVILDANRIAAMEAENRELRAEVEALAGEVEELRARLAFESS